MNLSRIVEVYETLRRRGAKSCEGVFSQFHVLTDFHKRNAKFFLFVGKDIRKLPMVTVDEMDIIRNHLRIKPFFV